jgi:hypothetical protein
MLAPLVAVASVTLCAEEKMPGPGEKTGEETVPEGRLIVYVAEATGESIQPLS